MLLRCHPKSNEASFVGGAALLLPTLSRTVDPTCRYIAWCITRESSKIADTKTIETYEDDALTTYLAIQPCIEGIQRDEPEMLFLNGIHPIASGLTSTFGPSDKISFTLPSG